MSRLAEATKTMILFGLWATGVLGVGRDAILIAKLTLGVIVCPIN